MPIKSSVFAGLVLLALPCAGGGWKTSKDEGLRQAVDRAIYRLEPSGSASYSGRNPAQRLALEFDAHHARLQHPAGSVGFRLTGYPAALPESNGDRIEYRRAELTEWYRNDARGLEQGFTLAHRPGGARWGEPLVIRLAVEGELRPVLAPGGQAVLLQRHGDTVLRYAGLQSWDARGRVVPSRLDVRGREIRLVVDDSHAEYPLVVDPTWTQQGELVSSDGTPGDDFGYSIAVSGNTAVVGAPDKTVGANVFQGAAYVFVRNGATWTQQQELTAFDGLTGDQFGYSVSISTDTVVVGAPFKAVGLGIIQGTAYVFVRTGTTWTMQQEIVAADGEPFDFFGAAVSVSADTAVVTSAGKNSDEGAAYVFVRSGTTWSQQQELAAFDGSGGDVFGTSVSLSGDTAVIGAQGKNAEQGAIYVFVRSGTVWSSLQEVGAADRVNYDNFGRSVSLSGNTILVGAPQKTIGSNTAQGAAYVFVFNGTSWTQQQVLTASDGAANDAFGSSVSLSGDTAVIGAPEKSIGSNSQQGAAYQFGRGGTNWTQQQELTATDGVFSDEFGFSVSIGIAGTAGTIMAGAPGKQIGQNNSQGAGYALSNQAGGGGSNVGAVSVTPNSGSGLTRLFSAVYTDVAGATDLQVVYLDFGSSTFAANSCIVAYIQASNTLSLYNDGANGLVSGSVTPAGSGTASNSQCSISGAGGAVAQSGNNLTVPIAITFAPSFTGSKNIYGFAQNYNGTNGGWQTLGTWTPAAPLSAVSVSPSTGSGASQTFTAVYNDPAGATDLQVVYFDIATTAGATHSCFAAYVQASNTLLLYNDAGTALVSGSITPGSSGTLSNSQCTLSSGGPVTTSGGNLTVPFALSFRAGFAGAKSMYGFAQSFSGVNGGWQTLGSWTVQAPSPVTVTSVTPTNGTGLTQTFTAVYTDPSGEADLQVVDLDFGSAAFAANSCIVAYVQSSNTLFLFNDSTTGLASGSATPGGSGTASNSQCSISGAGGAVTQAGNNLTVPVAITFAPSFAGSKNVYALAQSYSGTQSPWQLFGTWTPTVALSAVSVSPNTGSGASQTFTAVYNDPAGATDLQVVYFDIATTAGAAHSCLAAYVQASNTLSLYNDAGTALVSGSITPGSPGILSNSQCTLSSGGPVSTSGGNLTVPVTISFTAAFIGAKSVYGFAQSYSGANGGWQTLGTWTVQAPPPLSVTSVSPSSGTGLTQTFTTVYTDPSGAADLQVVDLDFGSAAFGANSCIVAYVQSTNTLFLFNDSTTGFVSGSVTPGGSGTASNSQCSISGAGGAVAQSGNNLSVPVAITFAPSFAGSKNIFGLAQNYSGSQSGWRMLGTWTPTAPLSAVSVSPNTGSGATQTFTAVYNDPAGATDLQVVYLDIATTAGSTHSCYAAYVPASNTLSLFNDTGTAVVSGSITPGSPGTLSNAQCTLSSGGSITASGGTLTVPFTFSFAAGFAGAKSVYGFAQSYSGANGGWQTLGTWTVQAPPPLTVTSVSPNSGSGPTQTFTAIYTDPSGASDLQVVYLDFGSSVFGPHSCIAAYVQSSQMLFLYNDGTTGLVSGSITPGSSSTLSNSQCTLSGSGGPVTQSGNNLTVPFAITFASGFTGSQNIYGLEQNYAGASSVWKTLGTWLPNLPLSAVSVTPNNGTGVTQTFNAVYSDPAGAADLQVVYLDFGNSTFAANSCIVAYVQATNTLSLYNDAATGLASGSATPGGSGSTSNSQCTITGAAGPVSLAGTNLTIPVAVTFSGGFTGSKTIFALAQSYSGSSSGWQTLGTWTPVFLGALSVSPVNGGGFGPTTFNTVIADSNGASDLQVVYLDFGGATFSAHSCIVAYIRGSNTLSLYNDGTTGLVPGSITPGGAGTLSNTQCAISSGGAVTASGSNLTIPVSITFTNAFGGLKNVYVLAQSYSGASGGWQTMGTWNP